MQSLILATFAAVIVVVLVRRRGDLKLGLAGWYLVIGGLLYQAPTAIAKITGSYVQGREIGATTYIGSLGFAEGFYRVADIALVIATFVIFVVVSTRTRVFISTPAVLLALMVALGMVSYLIRTDATPGLQSILLLLAVLAAGSLTSDMRSVVAGGALVTLFTALIGTALAVANPAVAFISCSNKCSIAGQIYTGASSHGNALGLQMTLGLTFVWLAFRGADRAWTVGYLLLAVILSGSRTSMLAVAIVLLVLAVTNPKLGPQGMSSRFSRFGSVVAVSLTVVAIAVPFFVRDDLFATGRGLLWKLALKYVEASPFFGYGSQSWSELHSLGLFGAAAAYATHNQFLEALFVGGLFGLMLFVAVVLRVIFEPDRARRAAMVPLLVAILALGVAERPIAIDLVSPTTWALLGLLLLSRSSIGDVSGISAAGSQEGRAHYKRSQQSFVASPGPIGTPLSRPDRDNLATPGSASLAFRA